MSRCGTPSKYSAGCRCDACREAHRVYVREWLRKKRRIQLGLQDPDIQYVDASEVRAHLQWLSTHGIGRRTVSTVTGLSQSCIQNLTTGQVAQCKPRTAELILAVNLAHRPAVAAIDGTRTRNQITDLLARGWTKRAIGRVLTGNPNAQSLQLGNTISVKHAATINRLWQQAMAPELADRELVAERKRVYRAKQRTNS
jgi:hypothetical protein